MPGGTDDVKKQIFAVQEITDSIKTHIMGGTLSLQIKTLKTRAEDVLKVLKFSLLHYLKGL